MLHVVMPLQCSQIYQFTFRKWSRSRDGVCDFGCAGEQKVCALQSHSEGILQRLEQKDGELVQVSASVPGSPGSPPPTPPWPSHSQVPPLGRDHCRLRWRRTAQSR